jgi:hypothetical protein
MMQKLSSLSLQWNDLSGTIPEHYLKNLLQLKAFQIEGNDKLIGKIKQHNLLCQMRNKCESSFLSFDCVVHYRDLLLGCALTLFIKM